jgi:hypothetical protein
MPPVGEQRVQPRSGVLFLFCDLRGGEVFLFLLPVPVHPVPVVGICLLQGSLIVLLLLTMLQFSTPLLVQRVVVVEQSLFIAVRCRLLPSVAVLAYSGALVLPDFWPCPHLL